MTRTASRPVAERDASPDSRRVARARARGDIILFCLLTFGSLRGKGEEGKEGRVREKVF
jgi:hypothetical protein